MFVFFLFNEIVTFYKNKNKIIFFFLFKRTCGTKKFEV